MLFFTPNLKQLLLNIVLCDSLHWLGQDTGLETNEDQWSTYLYSSWGSFPDLLFLYVSGYFFNEILSGGDTSIDTTMFWVGMKVLLNFKAFYKCSILFLLKANWAP